MFVSQNLFALAGQLFATSICQGGPAPSFLASWVYNYLVHGSNATFPINAHSLDGRDSNDEELFKEVLHSISYHNYIFIDPHHNHVP